MRRFGSLAVLAAIALLIPGARAQSHVTTADVRLRSGPGTSNPALLTIPRGAAVDVISCTSWCGVTYGGTSGYVSARYLRTISGASAGSAWATSSTDSEARSSGGRTSGRVYHVGPRAGCYYVSASGRNVYVDRSRCGGVEPAPRAIARPRRAPSARSLAGGGASRYIRGPRGGCYYINRNGNRTYVERSLCN